MSTSSPLDRTLVIATVLAIAAFLPYSVYSEFRFSGHRIGATISSSEDGVHVHSVIQDSPADLAGIEAGDHILAIDGARISDDSEYANIARTFERGVPAAFLVHHEGQQLERIVSPGTPLTWTLVSFEIFLVLSYLLIGLAALGRSPNYINGHLLFYFTAAVAFELALPDGFQTPLTNLPFYFLSGLEMALELHLVLLIPERAHWNIQYSWIVRSCYALGAAWASLMSLAYLANERQVAVLSWFPGNYASATDALHDGGFVLWALAVPVILIGKVFGYEEKEGRIQTGIMLAAVLPWSILALAVGTLGFLGISSPTWLEPALTLALLAYPLALLVSFKREERRRLGVLLELGDEILKASSTQQVLDLLRADVDAALRPKWVHVLLFDPFKDRLIPQYAPDNYHAHIVVPALEELMVLAAQERRPFAPTDLSISADSALRSEWRDETAPQLIVPLMSHENFLFGLILMGEKKSEDRYTPSDRQLLSALSGSVALALENATLKRQVMDPSQAHPPGVLRRIRESSRGFMKECPACRRCYEQVEDTCPSDGAKLKLSLPVERTVANRYRLDKLIGKGGMGVVYEANDLRLGRRVAVKILCATDFGDEQALRRFEREARICARLNHPHIVAVHDYGVTESGGGFLVMELLEGSTLRQVLDRFGSLRPTIAGLWIGEVLEGLEAAHGVNVIHRDLKPSNIFVPNVSRAGEHAKILDFGLAKVRASGVSVLATLTQPGMLLGTLPYMAPEQIRGHETDHRIDLYAVGVMTIEAITGARPFQATTTESLTHAVLHNDYTYPNGRDAPELAKTLERSIAKNPSDRFPSAKELRLALDSACRPISNTGAELSSSP